MIFEPKTSNYVIEAGATLEAAMATITANRRGAVVVIGDGNVLQGILSDGDIRRAMLRGGTMLTPISKALNMNVTTLTQATVKKAQKIFEENAAINLVPVVNTKNVVVDVLVRGEK